MPPKLTLTEELTARQLSQEHDVPLWIVRRDMILMRGLPNWELREIAGQKPTFWDRLLKPWRK